MPHGGGDRRPRSGCSAARTTCESSSDVLDGGGSAVAIGDPGVGKSSLLKVADQLAQRRGRRVLSVTPTQFDRGLPFAGLAELIGQVSGGSGPSASGPATTRRSRSPCSAPNPTAREVDALAVPLAVRGLLTHLCESEPVALIIDDLQWLDQASVGSLGFALRRISVEPHRLSVLVGTQTGGRRHRPDPEPGRAATRVHAAARWRTGRSANCCASAWVRDGLRPMSAGVARASSGNPFLALMIAQAMQSDLSKWCWSDQDGHDPVFPVPPSLAGLLGEKVTLLPQDSRDVLLLVSAAGRLTVAQLQGIVEEARAPVGPGSRRGLRTWRASAPGRWSRSRTRCWRRPSTTPPHRPNVVARTAFSPRSSTTRWSVLATARGRSPPPTRRSPSSWSRQPTSPGAVVRRHLAGDLLEGAALATPSGADTADELRPLAPRGGRVHRRRR